MSFGSTGISSPKPMIASTRVTKMKPVAGFRVAAALFMT
jgi:hypothetical protein